VFEELESLCKTAPDEPELRKAKNQCVSHFLNDLETTFDQGFQLGLWDTLFRWEGLNEYIERLEAASASQIQETAAKYCDPNQATVCVTAPDST
jgi:zinc protease